MVEKCLVLIRMWVMMAVSYMNYPLVWNVINECSISAGC
jgi:hypothetical protein